MPEARRTRPFTPASELVPRSSPRQEDARFVCEMDGQPAIALCESCLKALVETMVEGVLERLIDQGKLDGVLQRVLVQRAARGDAPHVDHSLIDEVSGEIRD